MAEFKIITDSTADLPGEYIEQNHLGMMVLPYIVNEEPYGIGKEMEVKEFYQQMRGGMMPTTSQVNPETAKEYLENYLEECSELLVLSFSYLQQPRKLWKKEKTAGLLLWIPFAPPWERGFWSTRRWR